MRKVLEVVHEEVTLLDAILLAVIVIGALALFVGIRFLLARKLRRFHAALRSFLRPLAFLMERAEEVLLGGALLFAAVIGVLRVLDVDLDPVTGGLIAVGKAVGNWLLEHALPVALIALAAIILRVMLHRQVPLLLESRLTREKEGIPREEALQRAQTVSGVIVSTGTVAIFTMATFLILGEIDINLAPVLVGFGVAGIAVGFGAQHLVRDFISGLLIVMEDQYSKGDVVEVAGKAGLVEDMNLRRTVLRDLDGRVHTIPNGEISVATNFTKDWSRVNMNIGVAYKEDIDKVWAVLERVGTEMAEDPDWKDVILEAPKPLRVDNFADSAVEIKVLGVTKPIRQWDVMGELRRRIKKTFDAEGIEIPFPHVTVYWGVGSQGAHPFNVNVNMGAQPSQGTPSEGSEGTKLASQ